MAFEDFYAIEEFDDEHSTAEEARYKMLALAGEKILVVVYTMRGENFRIISAREAQKYERELYERQRSENER
ncbi:MAG TPA: BrnT family toxin, partial [Pyrinomonadaceae bacterium]|nr:BrnT family toxin [Pyrinomonadaceae bacterium]